MEGVLPFSVSAKTRQFFRVSPLNDIFSVCLRISQKEKRGVIEQDSKVQNNTGGLSWFSQTLARLLALKRRYTCRQGQAQSQTDLLSGTGFAGL
jgi:hypothetical protein